jgi:predicted nucleic acid-binding protein
MILVDSNVIIDIFEEDPRWADWSTEQIAVAGKGDGAMINEVVIAEVAPSHGSLERFLTVMESFNIGCEAICNQSAFTAGLAFLEYRKRRIGAKSIIADFLIGGHAQTLGATILTRDPRFYRAYFPTVPIIAPQKDEHD